MRPSLEEKRRSTPMKKFLGLLLSMVSVASAEATTITVWCTDGAETQI